MKMKLVSMVMVILQLVCGLCIPVKAENIDKESLLMERALSLSKVSLFAKTGSGEYYTLYPEGVEKEDAYIGGFKSVQLDPQEENIYFYDTGLKVISRINIKDGKVYKVIGKPKSSKTLNYTTPVAFKDAELGKIIDFSFDKYGNIFILDSFGENNTDQRILKASLKDNTVKEVLNVNNQFLPVNIITSFNLTFKLTGLSSDADHNLYLYGNCDCSRNGYGIYHWTAESTNWTSESKPFVVLKYYPVSNSIEFYNPGTLPLGYKSKIASLNNNGSNYFSVKGIAFDHDNVCYVSANDYVNSQWISKSIQYSKDTNSDGILDQEPFIGNDNINPADLGDGGLAENAYASLSGSMCICGDKSGDIYVADNVNNRVRKVFKNGGYITTVGGGGTESISFGEEKSVRFIALKTPTSLSVDKSNNLYIAEPERIIRVSDLVVHNDKPTEMVKVANLAISKIAGIEVSNPKGEVSLPDLKLDYTYAGDQTVEVKATNIPNGTAVKLFTVGEGVDNSNPPSAKLLSGIASVPLKINAGVTKVIKAETDPFIPAPGVYLPGTEPKVAEGQGQLLTEPENSLQNRGEVNKNINLISPSARFNFKSHIGWLNGQYTYNWDQNNTKVTSFAATDPDNAGNDGTLIEFGPNQDTYYLNNIPNASGNVTFSIWMRTDSTNVNVPIGTGPACNGPFSACYPLFSLISSTSFNNTGGGVYQLATVTPSWQKFTVNNPNGAGSIFIGGLGQTTNKKIYVWGARVEKSQ